MLGFERRSRVKGPVAQPRNLDEGIQRRRVAAALHRKKADLPPYWISLDRKCLQGGKSRHMLGSKDYPEPRGCQMLQVQVPAAAVSVLRWCVGKAKADKLMGDIAVGAIQDGRLSKRLDADRWEVRELMRRGENRDVTLFEQRPVVDPFWLVLHVAHDGHVYLALQQKLDKAVWRLFSKLDMEAGHEFANFSDRLKNERSGNGWGEADSEWRHLLLLKLPRSASNCLRRCKCALKHRQHRFPQVSEVGELTLPIDKLTPKLLLQLLHAFGQRRLRDVAHLRSAREIQRARNS